MEIKNRKNIQEFIVYIESHFNVNQWKANDIYIWPFLRISLYFYLIDKVESKVKNITTKAENTVHKKKSLYLILKQKIVYHLKMVFKIYRYKKWISKVNSKEWLFVGMDAHRVDFRKSRYNRYFDIFIEKNNLNSKYAYLEYDDLPILNQYIPENVFNFKKALSDYCFIHKNEILTIDTKGYVDFLNFLEANSITKNFSNIWSITNLKKWASGRFIPKVKFFIELFRKKNFKKVAVLCYYSEDIMAMMVAANSQKIETIEMQHGPQSDIHMAYSNWMKLPNDSYQMLPRTFWHWDNASMHTVKKWTSKNELYKNILVGNFWIDYWKEKKEEYGFNNYVLYSLQTYPFTIEELFSNKIIDCIKKSNVLWFVRLHPRQLNKKDDILRFLKEKNIEHLINIENATFDILPKVLSNAKFHVTNFSGTTIEAELMNIETVLIHQDGLITFPKMVKNKRAFYIPQTSLDFEVNFLNFLNSRFDND